jgi:hypothetical protein
MVTIVSFAILLILAGHSPFPRLTTPPGKVTYFMLDDRCIANEVFLVRSGSMFDVIDTDEASWDRVSRLITDRPYDLLRGHLESTVAKRGYPFPMWESGMLRIALEPLPRTRAIPGQSEEQRPRWEFSTLELSQARAAYWNYAVDIDSESAAALEHEDVRLDRVLPLGFLFNGLSLAVFSVLVFSLIGMPRYLRYATAQRRLRGGVCGICRYDLSMIERSEEGIRCPECGAVWGNVGR